MHPASQSHLVLITSVGFNVQSLAVIPSSHIFTDLSILQTPSTLNDQHFSIQLSSSIHIPHPNQNNLLSCIQHPIPLKSSFFSRHKVFHLHLHCTSREEYLLHFFPVFQTPLHLRSVHLTAMQNYNSNTSIIQFMLNLMGKGLCSQQRLDCPELFITCSHPGNHTFRITHLLVNYVT